MSGKLKEAFAMVKKEKSVGWSYQSNAGIVFGSILSVISEHSKKAVTIETLLKNYAGKSSIYSGRISIEDSTGTSFYTEIIRGLKYNKDIKSGISEYFKWADKIGQNRIDHIVSNKHRRAYERAEQVLGSLAEAYSAMEQNNKATKILHKYYNEKYNRFSAFRREVKAVITKSQLLTNIGFI